MNNFTKEQEQAYKRFIKARNSVALGQYRRYNNGAWQPTADVLCTVDIAGMNHPMFIENDDWIEYKEASLLWWAVEPAYRKTERMSMIRGDYGDTDSWRDKATNVREIV